MFPPTEPLWNVDWATRLFCVIFWWVCPLAPRPADMSVVVSLLGVVHSNWSVGKIANLTCDCWKRIACVGDESRKSVPIFPLTALTRNLLPQSPSKYYTCLARTITGQPFVLPACALDNNPFQGCGRLAVGCVWECFARVCSWFPQAYDAVSMRQTTSIVGIGWAWNQVQPTAQLCNFVFAFDVCWHLHRGQKTWRAQCVLNCLLFCVEHAS